MSWENEENAVEKARQKILREADSGRYKTPEGEPCSLQSICRTDPEWAASRIEHLSQLARAKTVGIAALDHYIYETGSPDGQVDMCIEECAELTKALLKLRRDENSAFRVRNVRQELADVQIMVFQMMKLHGWDESMVALEAKTRRLEERIAK